MRYTLRHAFAAAAALSLLLICNRAGFADDADAVQVKYAKGESELDTVNVGVKFCIGAGDTFRDFPDELGGTTFVRRAPRTSAPLTIDAPSGITVYFMFGDGPGAGADRTACESIGCARVGPAHLSNGNGLLVYKLVTTDAKSTTIKCAGLYGIIVASSKLALNTDNNGDKKPLEPTGVPGTTGLHIDATPDITPLPGPTTNPVGAQASITALEIHEREHGMMLGQTTEETLTLTGSKTPKAVAVRFVTKVGDQMCLARDEAVRFIRLKYPNWYVSKAEITFEDKYIPHEGGSGSTAVGTMILSCIQGFNIDPDVAITGDISANGKVRAIGGVSAKIKGAIASKCSLVAIPADNLDQLVDAVTYNGPEMVENIQVIGIADLDEAVATVRTDRDPKLTQAIAIFSGLQKRLKAKPEILKGKDAQADLAQVLDLAPQHLSAQVLLAIAQGKQPKTLSATASLYYTFMAVGNMMDVLKQRSDSSATDSVPSSVVRSGLANLRKLRPLADPAVRPLIDAWASFVGAWNEQQEGIGSPQSVEKRRQALLDEMAKEDADADLMQKMLREGM